MSRRSATVATTLSGRRATWRTQIPGRQKRREDAALTRTGDRPPVRLASSPSTYGPRALSPTTHQRWRLKSGWLQAELKESEALAYVKRLQDVGSPAVGLAMLSVLVSDEFVIHTLP